MLARSGTSTHPDLVDPEPVRDLMSRDRVVLVDARPRNDYLRAKHPDRARGPRRAGDVLLSIPQTKLIVACCDEPDHAASAQVARRARVLGRVDASILNGGFAGWKGRGHPVEKTPHADLPRDSRPSL